MQFTDKFVKSLKPKAVRYDQREGSGNGFMVRVFPSGQKSWGCVYHFEGKKYRITFGNYPALSLADARRMHADAMRYLGKGINPGQRKGEILAAEWQEIDVNSGGWLIPAHKSKNGTPHHVLLSTLVLSLLEELKALSGGSQWLFPSPTGKVHIACSAIDHALRKNLPVFENVKKFTPHDLRRTAASHMTALGLSRLVMSKILNHAEGSVGNL